MVHNHLLIQEADQYLVYVSYFSQEIRVVLIDRAHLFKRLFNLLGTDLRKMNFSLMMERERRNLIMNSSSLISIVKDD